MTKIQTFYCKDEKLLEEVDKIRWRDKKSISQVITIALEELVKNHKDGNEQYTLDSPVLCTPALFRPFDIWKEYYQKLSDNEEEDHKFKLQELINLHKQRFGSYPL